MSRVRGLPLVTLEAEGITLPDEAVRALGAVRVQQRLSLPTLCELAFFDPPGSLAAVERLSPGVSLRVSLPAHRTPLFTGQVTAVEHVYGPANEREIRVRAYDVLHRLRKRWPVRAHVDTSVLDLAREVAIDLGVSVQAADSGPLWPRIIQYQQSDLDLLCEMAARSGLYLTMRENTLHLITLEGFGEEIELDLGRNLLEARVELNGDGALRSVDATGWDPRRVEIHQGSASGPRSGRHVFATINPTRVGGDGERKLVGQVVADDNQAEALAQATLDAQTAREVTLWGMADGDPRLRPGAPVDVAGIVDQLAGRYVLTSVNHTIDERMGYVSEIATTPPPIKQWPRGAVIAPANVIQVDDPQELGRVRVSLPTYGDLETEWLGVLSLGAGKGRGLVMLPDVGDHVLVIFSHEDPAAAVVLGGLYGAQELPTPE